MNDIADFIASHGKLKIFVIPIIIIWQLSQRLVRSYKIWLYIKSHDIICLQVGTGNNILEGWFNTDYYPYNKNIVFLDAASKFPFDDNTFDYIFTEHMIEHISYEKGICMLKECYRILKPGGVIRISTPDIQFLVDLFKIEKTVVQQSYIRWTIDKFMPKTNIYSETFVVNNFFHSFGHQFIYDFMTIKNILEKMGFVNIGRCVIGESDYKMLRKLEQHKIPDKFNNLETMVIEAKKKLNK